MLLALAGCSARGFTETKPTPITIVVTATSAPIATNPPQPTQPRVVTHSVFGTLTVGDADPVLDPGSAMGSCQGGIGYDDIHAGAQALVKDGDGHTLAVADLGPGKVTDVKVLASGGGSLQCQFAFTMRDVPDAPFYAFSFGRRGGPTYTNSELVAASWSVELTLGI